MPLLASKNHPIDCGLATTSNFSRQFAKKSVSNRAIDIIAIEVERGNGTVNSTTTETIGDASFTKTNFSSTVTDCLVNVVPVKQNLSTIASIESSNTSILSNPLESNPFYLSYESNGTVSVSVLLNTGEKACTKFTTQTKTPSPSYSFDAYLENSLADHVSNQTNLLADDSTTPPNHYSIYSTFNQQSNIYEKNPSFWASDLDFTGVTVNKQGSGGVTSVSAITPRHAIGAAHYPPEINDVMYFCNSNNQTITRTIVDRSFAFNSDTVIVKFDQDLPNTVKKYKFLPSGWFDYLPFDYPTITTPSLPQGLSLNFSGYNIPMLVMSHFRWDNEWALQRNNRYVYIYNSIIQSYVLNGTRQLANIGGSTVNSQHPNYNGEPSGIRAGDSGLPCFYIINGDLVLVMKHLGPANGQFLSDYLSGITSAINEVGSEGYSIQTVDISEFTDFSS